MILSSFSDLLIFALIWLALTVVVFTFIRGVKECS